MSNKLTDNIFKKYPQLEESSLAIKEYKKTGNQTIKCSSCSSVIEIKESKKEGFLETNCDCGKNKTRLRWDPDKAQKQ